MTQPTKERGVLLNQDMVRAILDGRKTQTRRPMKVQPDMSKLKPGYANKPKEWRKMVQLGPVHHGYDPNVWVLHDVGDSARDVGYSSRTSPYGKVGDRLYVRERARLIGGSSNGTFQFKYETDGTVTQWIKIPERIKTIDIGNCCSNGCFKELARIWLEITGVRVERVPDISEADAIAEGIRKVTKDDKLFKYCIYDKGDYSTVPWCDMTQSPIPVFQNLWESCYPGSWERNDWVFKYEFKRIEK